MLALAVPALAQTGRIQGKVVDDKDAPVADAQILVTAIPDQGGQKWQAKSDKNGNYIIGTLPKSGQYLDRRVERRRRRGRSARRGEDRQLHDDELQALARRARQRGAGQEEPGDQEILRGRRHGGQCGQPPGRGRRVHRRRTAMPTCADCYFNVGVSQQQMKNSEAAEAAFKKAIELRPNYPEAYNALAVLYTQDKKMDLAAAASAKSAELSIASGGGGNADSLYSAGVGLWNANKFAEAGSTFEAALKANPNHADSHFMLGKVNLNLGKLKEAAGEYETYLKLEPAGKNAAEAKTTFEALKPMLK